MASVNSKTISKSVTSTTKELIINDTIYHGDVDAYTIEIDFTDVSSISGTCNLHFVLPDGTTLDRDESDGVTITDGEISYMLETYMYAQAGTLTMYVQFLNSNIYTPLKVIFKNIVAIPDGGEEVVATTTYPVWYDEVVTNEDERVAAELIRVSNEVSRVTAEDARATWEEFNSSTVYAVGEKVYYPTTGSSYILHTASGVANTLPTDTDYWQIIVEKGASSIIDEFSETDITGVIAGDGTNIITASADDLPYVNTTSGLTATDTQAAIDELADEKADNTVIGNRTYTENNYVTDLESVTDSIDALDIALADVNPPLSWTTVTTFSNDWEDRFSSTWPVQYSKDALGIVRLRGFINGGANATVAFTLPEGYRPNRNVMFASVVYGGTSTYPTTVIYINSSGEVNINKPSSTDLAYIPLDVVSYTTS